MSNQVYENDYFRYIDYNFRSIESKLPQPPVQTTLSMSGPFVASPFTFKYIVFSQEITLLFPAISYNSTIATTQISSVNVLPMNIWPAVDMILPCTLIIGTTTEQGLILITTTGSVSLFRQNSVAFPTGQVVGVQRCQITYPQY